MSRLLFFAAALLAAVPLAAPSASAQEYGRIEDTQSSVPGYFFFARPGEAVVSVTATGGLTTNGRFLVGVGTDVGDLVAFAGGVRGSTAGRAVVRLYRGGEVAYEADVRRLYDDEANAPVLQDGDVVEVVSLASSVPGFFVHTEPGQEPIAVTAAGAFAAPGRYVLDAGATLEDLLALAGGSRAGGQRDVRTEVTTTIRLYRDGGVALTLPLEAAYASQEPVPLQAGDVVDLEVVQRQRSAFTWRDGVSLVAAVAGVTLTILQITRTAQ